MNTKIVFSLFGMAFLISCVRIETGEVGIRVKFDKTIDSTELQPGTFNQTFLGTVLTFPVKDVAVDVADLTPLASDNSTMKEVDVTVIYNINPTSVAELWTEKSKSFHATNEEGDILLMFNYIAQTTRNATYKSIRPFEALKANDNRSEIEAAIRENIINSLKEENLANSINISQVQVRKIAPSEVVIFSANALVQAQNEFKKKQVEVETAKKEAERIAVLNANKGAIEYMDAMANMLIAEAIKEGKVNTIVIPRDFKGMVNIK